MIRTRGPDPHAERPLSHAVAAPLVAPLEHALAVVPIPGVTRAEAARDKLLPLMAACRAHADALEGMVDDVMWPLPKYNEMLWQQ